MVRFDDNGGYAEIDCRKTEQRYRDPIEDDRPKSAFFERGHGNSGQHFTGVFHNIEVGNG